MTGYRKPVDAAALAQNFRVFANAECANEPLYAALSHAIARQPELLALVLEAPYRQRRPVLLFATVHDLLLAGVQHPLARFYRTVVDDAGLRTDVEHAPPVFADFCRSRRTTLAAMLEERTTQTNEIGRGAVLRLVLAGLDRARPLALVDVGCSAGLNLLVDRYRFVYHDADGAAQAAGPASSPVVIRARLDGHRPASSDALPPIAARIGIDLAPLDVHDPLDARWLRACVWPSDDERQARLVAAMGLARETRLDLRRGAANDLLASVFDAIDREVRPVVFHSWVVSYFDGASRVRFASTMRDLVLARDGVWISAEAARVVPGLPADGVDDTREATFWHATTRGPDGTLATRLLALSHAHGRWIEWRETAAS